MVIALCCLAVVGIVAWLLSQEGIFGAASTFLIVVVSGLVAMNFFEPATLYLQLLGPMVAEYADILALVGLFAALVIGPGAGCAPRGSRAGGEGGAGGACACGGVNDAGAA